MKKYTTLFLDLDNTLLDFYAAESYAIEKLFSKYGLDNSKKTVALYSKINKEHWESFERGEKKKEEILTLRFKKTLEAMGEERDPVALNRDYFLLLSSCHFLLPGAMETVSAIKKKGYCLYLTTNGVAKTQYKRIEESGLAPFFDDVFVSETAGAQKPSREYFDFVYNHSGEKDKSKILVVGDSMTSDIKGGIDSGFDTVWLDGFGEEKLFEPTYRITDITELNNLL